MLQPFHVLRIEQSRQNIVLLDSNKRPPPNKNYLASRAEKYKGAMLWHMLTFQG